MISAASCMTSEAARDVEEELPRKAVNAASARPPGSSPR